MAYTIISPPEAGFLPISATDSGIIPPNNANTGSTTTIPTPPLVSGMIVSAVDPTYGGGEFILLKGAASTVVGSLVKFDTTAFTTTLVTNTANQVSPVAVAMSANTDTAVWGWYQISGLAVVKKTAVSFSPGVAIYLSGTAGRVKAVASAGLQVQAAKTANTATVSAGVSTITVNMQRPNLQGQIT